MCWSGAPWISAFPGVRRHWPSSVNMIRRVPKIIECYFGSKGAAERVFSLAAVPFL